jgi:hypothetical protein
MQLHFLIPFRSSLRSSVTASQIQDIPPIGKTPNESSKAWDEDARKSQIRADPVYEYHTNMYCRICRATSFYCTVSFFSVRVADPYVPTLEPRLYFGYLIRIEFEVGRGNKNVYLCIRNIAQTLSSPWRQQGANP